MLSKAQVLEGEVILGQYLATENVEQVNDLFSFLWIKIIIVLVLMVYFHYFAAESKIASKIDFQPSSLPSPPAHSGPALRHRTCRTPRLPLRRRPLLLRTLLLKLRLLLRSSL